MVHLTFVVLFDDKETMIVKSKIVCSNGAAPAVTGVEMMMMAMAILAVVVLVVIICLQWLL